MKNPIFADFTNLVSSDKLRPIFGLAVVKNGRLIATDSHQVTLVNLKIYINDPVQLENVENKVFDKELLKRLSKAQNVEFLTDTMILTEKKNISQVFYTGEIINNSVFYRNEKTGLVDHENSAGRLPNYAAVIPGYKEKTGEIDFTDFKPKQHFLNTKLLSNIAAGFNTENVAILSNQRHLIIVALPTDAEKLNFDQFAVLMPAIPLNKDLNLDSFFTPGAKVEPAPGEPIPAKETAAENLPAAKETAEPIPAKVEPAPAPAKETAAENLPAAKETAEPIPAKVEPAPAPAKETAAIKKGIESEAAAVKSFENLPAPIQTEKKKVRKFRTPGKDHQKTAANLVKAKVEAPKNLEPRSGVKNPKYKFYLNNKF